MDKMSSQEMFTVKRLCNLDMLYVPLSAATKLPYVECDAETFDDQVYIFETKDECQAFVGELNEKIFPATVMEIEKKSAGTFFINLFLMGVNAVVFICNGERTLLQLEQVIQKPNIHNVEGQAPVINQTLQLTMIYMMQQLRRPGMDVKDPSRETLFKELNQELVANLQRSKFIVPVQQLGEKKADGKQLTQVQIIKTADGKVFQPIFTDMWELNKYVNNTKAKNDKYKPPAKLVVVDYAGLKPSLAPEAEGYVINIGSVNLTLLKGKF